jgi:hypothetical protein
VLRQEGCDGGLVLPQEGCGGGGVDEGASKVGGFGNGERGQRAEKLDLNIRLKGRDPLSA